MAPTLDFMGWFTQPMCTARDVHVGQEITDDFYLVLLHIIELKMTNLPSLTKEVNVTCYQCM